MVGVDLHDGVPQHLDPHPVVPLLGNVDQAQGQFDVLGKPFQSAQGEAFGLLQVAGHEACERAETIAIGIVGVNLAESPPTQSRLRDVVAIQGRQRIFPKQIFGLPELLDRLTLYGLDFIGASNPGQVFEKSREPCHAVTLDVAQHGHALDDLLHPGLR